MNYRWEGKMNVSRGVTLVVMLVMALAAPSASARAATFTLSPTSGPVGTSVHAQGGGFGNRQAGTVSFGTTIVLSFTTAANGSWSGNFNVPSGYSGAVTVFARTASAGVSKQFTVAADVTPPETTITSHPTDPTTSTDATFTFTSSEAGSTFACAHDNVGYAPCTSPVTLTGLAVGAHSFGVKATDPAGNPDSSPAVFSWTINPVSNGVQPVGPPGTWNLAWSDEFSGTSLDTTKWACNGWKNNNMTAGSLCSNITEANGQVKLVLDAGNHGAQMGSNIEYGATNGYLLPVGGVAEARVYLPGDAANCNGGIYNWGGFWTGASSTWPQDGEIDIEETLGGQASTNFHGWFNNARYDLNGPKPAGCWANGWHTYTVQRKATTDDVYWDGVLVWTVTTHDDGSGEALLLTNGYAGSSPNVLGDPGALLADYVRAWIP